MDQYPSRLKNMNFTEYPPYKRQRVPASLDYASSVNSTVSASPETLLPQEAASSPLSNRRASSMYSNAVGGALPKPPYDASHPSMRKWPPVPFPRDPWAAPFVEPEDFRMPSSALPPDPRFGDPMRPFPYSMPLYPLPPSGPMPPYPQGFASFHAGADRLPPPGYLATYHQLSPLYYSDPRGLPGPSPATGSPSSRLATSPPPPPSRAPRLSVREVRAMAIFVVRWCLFHGKFPAFGAAAEEMILGLTKDDIELAGAVGFVSHGEIETWQNVFRFQDPKKLLVDQYDGTRALRISLRTLLNAKISEHWSHKSKVLLRSVGDVGKLTRNNIDDSRLTGKIASWLGIDKRRLGNRALALAFWRINKKAKGNTLRAELAEARKRQKGQDLDGHTFARDTWAKEIEDSYKQLFAVEAEEGSEDSEKST